MHLPAPRLPQLIPLILIILAMVASADARQAAYNSKHRLAVAYYDSAQYDKAIDVLSDLAMDTLLQKAEKRDALLLLGRSYLAKSLQDKAKEAINQMLDLEPPPVVLDPDAECFPLMKLYYEARKSRTGSTLFDRPDPGMKTIAILDFKNRSLDDKARFDPMEKGFAELLINQLEGTVTLKVIERERIQWILDEIGLENNPDKFDVNSAVRVGKQLGVHTILLGSFINVKDKIKLLARLVKVETSEILATDEVTGDADKFFELTGQLGQRIVKKINVSLSRAELDKGTETRSLDAIMSYAEGLTLVEKAEYKKAYEKFMEALKFDPKYEKARIKAEGLKPLLG